MGILYHNNYWNAIQRPATSSLDILHAIDSFIFCFILFLFSIENLSNVIACPSRSLCVRYTLSSACIAWRHIQRTYILMQIRAVVRNQCDHLLLNKIFCVLLKCKSNVRIRAEPLPNVRLKQILHGHVTTMTCIDRQAFKVNHTNRLLHWTS